MRIPVFGLGIQSRSKSVTPARLVNLYIEQRPMGERSQLVAYAIPGLDSLVSAGASPWRGLLTVGTTPYMFGANANTFYQVDNAGTLTNRGTLNSVAGRVDIAHNGSVVLAVDGADGYTYTIASTTLAEIDDSDFLAGAKTCAWLDGYFVVEDGETFAISEDGASWDSTDRGVPEFNPDGIVRVVADHGELVILGQNTIEFWQNTGATDFPFAPLKSSTAEWGCAAKDSVVKANDSLTLLAKNSDGQAAVVRLRGYVPEVISTPDLEHILAGYATMSDATAFAYKEGGHPFYQINFPSADASWLYDAYSNKWSPVASDGIGRNRREIGVQFLDKTVVSDYANGQLYRINRDTHTENGETLAVELTSDSIRMPDGERFPVECFRLDMETGVGLATGQGSDPQVMLQVSRDGGHTWGEEQWRSAGRTGEYGRRVEWRALGSAAAWAFRVRMSDPVKRVFLSASINPDD